MKALHDVAAEAANAWYWANTYKASIALFALIEVGALEKLARARLSAAALADDLGLALQKLEPILDLLADLGILEGDENGFTLPRAAAALLPLLSLENLFSNKYIHRDMLVQILRGQDVARPMTGDDTQELLPTYLAAMAVGARALAPHLVRFARLGAGPRLLDLGGADGALVLAMGRLITDLQATVLDRPQVERAFWARVAAAGEQERLRFMPGDLRQPQDLTQALSQADTVLMSNVLHLLSDTERQELLQAILYFSAPGTRLLIYDQFLLPDAQLDAARFMVIDWLLSGYRFDYTEQAFAAQLTEMGFVSVTHRRTRALPGAMLRAIAPERRV